MAEFVKRPIQIEAVQWMGDNEEEVKALGPNAMTFSGDNILIETREGTMMADLRDWVVKGIADEVYPVKPEIFAATYKEVGEDLSQGEAP
jgi:hypothetical protein